LNAGPEKLRLENAGIRLDPMPPEGRDLALSVGEEERALVADRLGVTEIHNLDVSLHAVKFRGGMRVTGRLAAAVVQPSVVTFDPVRQEIDEPIDRIFLPGGDRPHAGTAGAEIFVDPDADDAPDYFEGPEVDFSELIIETLSLAIDPYPRATGEGIDDLGLPQQDDDDSPFARLKSLKNTSEKG
jgi:uncharacterized metal-binding protein YceD (DUF177 family)